MKIIHSIMILTVLLAGCTAAPQPIKTTSTPETLTVMVHDSFSISEPVLSAFETENNAKVQFIKGGDAGAMLNRAILLKKSPEADVLYGVDNTFLSRALNADIYESYQSPLLTQIAPEFQLDGQFRALPVDYGDVCLNIDKAYFEAKSLAIPTSLDDLIKPDYSGLLVTENPATSSPGLAFLLATIDWFGDPAYLNYWQQLKANGLVVVDGWETAYYTNFSGSSGKGSQPMVVSYATSPAAEVVNSDPPVSEPPTASVTAPGTCFRQVEFVGVLKGTSHKALAEKFVDFMLGAKFQEDMPLQMYVYPVNQSANLPEVFRKWAIMADSPAVLDAATISSNRDEWIAAWTKNVLK